MILSQHSPAAFVQKLVHLDSMEILHSGTLVCMFGHCRCIELGRLHTEDLEVNLHRSHPESKGRVHWSIMVVVEWVLVMVLQVLRYFIESLGDKV